MRSGTVSTAQFGSSVVIVSQDLSGRPDASCLHSSGSEKFRSIEKAVRAIEHGKEHRAVGSARDMDVAARPPDEVTRATAPFGVFQRSFEHEGLFERPSSSLYRIFISIPSNSVRCQGIDEAATKVDRSSGGLTGEGLFMASSPKSIAPLSLRKFRRLTPFPRCRSAPRVSASALARWSRAGCGHARSPPPAPSPRSSVKPQGPGRATRY